MDVVEQKKKKKKTKGRQVIPIQKIENTNSRQVSFCKRRKGLFNKTAQLCQFTGAAVGIIIPSLNRPNNFSTFGHPNIESVINNYQNNNRGVVESTATTPMSFEFSSKELELMQRNDMLNKEKKEGKKKIKIMNKEKKLLNNEIYWWNKEVDDLGLEELQQYSVALEELRKKVLIRADELVAAEGAGSSSSAAVVDDFDSILTDEYDDFFLDNAAYQCSI